ncbi:glycosyltransferase family 4 protein [Brenneria izbisi]|nr:glycosyltransferase family 1 protein [Brenneria izbisi]
MTQHVTGVQRFAEEISSQLVELRDDLIFLVPENDFLNKRKYNKGFNIEVVPGLKGHLWEQISLPLYLKRKGKPLLINLCNTAPAFYKNQIATHHDITYVRYPESFSFSFRLFYRILSPIMIKNSRDLITVSEFSKKEISSYYKCDPNKIHVINNAVSNLFNQEKSVQSNLLTEEYALTVSSPNYHKNFHGLIESFLSANLNLKLKIIGSNSGNFAKILTGGDGDERIEFLGRVDDTTLVNLYKNAKFFVFPSFYEGFGIPPLEAQACGCPVISSNRASLPEVLGDSVLYFEPDSKEDIISALNMANNDDDLRNTLKILGCNNILRFSWMSSAEKLNTLLPKKYES